jgi:hypothetical protein
MSSIEPIRKQPKRPRRKLDGLNECYTILSTTSTAINTLGGLTDRYAKHVREAVDILMILQTSRESKIYKAFLHDVIRKTSRALLCAAGLAKQRTVQLSEHHRIELIGRIVKNQSILHCLALDTLVDDYRPPSLSGLSQNTFITIQLLIQSRFFAGRPIWIKNNVYDIFYMINQKYANQS